MTPLYDQFKTSLINGIFSLLGRTWWKAVLITLLQTVASVIAMIPLVFSLFNWSSFQGIIEDPQGWTEQIQMNPESMFRFLGEDPDYAAIAVSFSLFFIIMIIVQSWAIHAILLVNQDEILEGKSDVSDILSRSFSSTLFRILGGTLVLSIIMIFTGLIVASTAAISGWITFFLAFPAVIFLYRFTLVYPLIVHSQMGIGDALSNSFQVVTWRRASILFLASIVVFIALFIAGMMLGMFSFILALIPIIGFIIYYAFNIAFNGLLYAFMYGAMSGLYYRYTEIDSSAVETDNLSKHLISND